MGITDDIRSALREFYKNDPEAYWGIHVSRSYYLDAFDVWVSDTYTRVSGPMVVACLKAGTLAEDISRHLAVPKPCDGDMDENPLIRESDVLRGLMGYLFEGKNNNGGYVVWAVPLYETFPNRGEGDVMTPGEHGVIVDAIKRFLAVYVIDGRESAESDLLWLERKMQEIIEKRRSKA